MRMIITIHIYIYTFFIKTLNFTFYKLCQLSRGVPIEQYLFYANCPWRRISDQGIPGSSPGRGAVRCGRLEQVTFTPFLEMVKPRKRWTDDRLGQTVTRLDSTLCLMCLVQGTLSLDLTTWTKLYHTLGKKCSEQTVP